MFSLFSCDSFWLQWNLQTSPRFFVKWKASGCWPLEKHRQCFISNIHTWEHTDVNVRGSTKYMWVYTLTPSPSSLPTARMCSCVTYTAHPQPAPMSRWQQVPISIQQSKPIELCSIPTYIPHSSSYKQIHTNIWLLTMLTALKQENIHVKTEASLELKS